MNLESELAEVVGAAHVIVDPAMTASYELDWTRRFHGRCRAVVRPASTEQVVGVLATCRRAGVSVVVQGGNTGLVGGATPAGGEVVLSTTRLHELGLVDDVAGQVTVGAGVTLATVQARVRRHGFDLGVDLGSRDSATVGGMVATNAGGERVLRYGSMRAQTVGLEAVLATGDVLSHLAGLPKENTGYDWVGLLAGSEGTLAVLTRVRLRLVPAAAGCAVALLGFADTQSALRWLAVLRRAVPDLRAAEVFYAAGLDLVRAHTGLGQPLREGHPVYLLVERAQQGGGSDAASPVLTVIEEIADAAGAPTSADAIVVSEPSACREIWRYREAHTEAINAVGIPVKLDVAVPLSALPDFVEQLAPTVQGVAPQARVIVFGHLAEGNLHVNVLDAGERAEPVTEAVLRAVVACGGAVSAEHGVGRAKVAWLGLSRTPAELAAMAALKRALDPDWMLGPGILLPVPRS